MHAVKGFSIYTTINIMLIFGSHFLLGIPLLSILSDSASMNEAFPINNIIFYLFSSFLLALLIGLLLRMLIKKRQVHKEQRNKEVTIYICSILLTFYAYLVFLYQL
ncbi:uncharacterized membrane protein YraQ (UPF0718 family) [Priestia taiwanensis]|uniref:Uncharacterized protein n=1 Tax=Priestia taiwanensis TaxID=1347902 RepID=A0A917AL55_9BACI|nr:uncharacterized membrane protein YraQ (UPF0718 family) [Priestia taiwanensis]GGE60086.1 hypothetical protein GCM10007140_08100 [Priestia taiwanensis]